MNRDDGSIRVDWHFITTLPGTRQKKLLPKPGLTAYHGS